MNLKIRHFPYGLPRHGCPQAYLPSPRAARWQNISRSLAAMSKTMAGLKRPSGKHTKLCLNTNILWHWRPGYYTSICFDVLMRIIKSYVTHPILLTLARKACQGTETCGGLFYNYYEKGIPKGSPLSPLLGAIALIPLDKAMERISKAFFTNATWMTGAYWQRVGPPCERSSSAPMKSWRT